MLALLRFRYKQILVFQYTLPSPLDLLDNISKFLPDFRAVSELQGTRWCSHVLTCYARRQIQRLKHFNWEKSGES
jgi:hypothetical protein